MSQPCVLKHASEITVFAVLRHCATKQYVGYAEFKPMSKDALVFICKGDRPLPSVTTIRNHFIEEVDISWLRDVAPRALEVASTVGHVQLDREPR